MKRSIDSIRGKLQSDQLKIDSRVDEQQLQPYTDKSDEISLEQYYNDGKLMILLQHLMLKLLTSY